MRLLDQVAQASASLTLPEDAGGLLLPGAGAHAAALHACPVRWVVDRSVADYCAALLDTDHDMLAGENAFLRVPVSDFWLEWPCPPGESGLAGVRAGLLVDADAAGRAGQVTTFWEQATGEPVVAQMTARFDLDRDLVQASIAESAYALAPGSHPLAPHLLLSLEPVWTAYFDRQPPDATARAAAQIVTNILPGIEFLFAFSALLAERACLARQATDLSRLNRQRARNGRPALLDHEEVRLDLEPVAGAAQGPTGGREAARLHAVRGHMVRRAGQSFWRRSHLRGDPTRAIRPRTVRVFRTAG